MATIRLVTDSTGEVTIDKGALEWYLNSLDGPAGVYMQELAVEMARVAKAGAPILKPGNLWNPVTSSALSKVPGNLKEGVYAKAGYSKTGKLYGGANAIEGQVTAFMEDPARQIEEKRAFMTAALWSAGSASVWSAG